MDEKYKKPDGSYISFMSNKVKLHGGINLAQGIPGFNPPEELTRLLSTLATTDLHQYAPGNGNHELLDLLLKKYHPEFNFSRDNFLVLQGATEALSLLYIYFNRILPHPFSALAFDPVYESYKHLPKIFNTGFVSFPLREDSTVDFSKLEKVCREKRVKVIFLGTPGNPLGKIWSRHEVDQLLKISKALDVFIVFDAVYRELYFEDKPYIPLDQFNENLFYVNSFSKVFSITGWRVGYLVAHQTHMEQIRSIHDYTGLCAPSVLQEAIVHYLRKYNYGEQYIASLRENLKTSFQLLSSELKNLGFNVPETRGGYFVWARLPQGYSDGFKFAVDLYEQQKVAVIPGEHFSPRATDYIRLNIARPLAEVRQGIERMNDFFNH
ncbi:MAG: pyridoxal phosphate-dependent aminotransferase [Bacteroidales bacterium]|jgi:aspartate/methionine/tyrosine aminotransferase|nr:pyridoxal phosphate-dependent aminotransferase [Bacteroidales bacterium]